MRTVIWPLAAAAQMLDQTALNMALDLTVGAAGAPEGKVVRPTFQAPVLLSNQGWDRLETLMTVGHLVQLLPLPLDRFHRRKHILPGPSADLSTRAVPNHPGRPAGCLCLLLHQRSCLVSS